MGEAHHGQLTTSRALLPEPSNSAAAMRPGAAPPGLRSRRTAHLVPHWGHTYAHNALGRRHRGTAVTLQPITPRRIGLTGPKALHFTGRLRDTGRRDRRNTDSLGARRWGIARCAATVCRSDLKQRSKVDLSNQPVQLTRFSIAWLPAVGQSCRADRVAGRTATGTSAFFSQAGVAGPLLILPASGPGRRGTMAHR